MNTRYFFKDHKKKLFILLILVVLAFPVCFFGRIAVEEIDEQLTIRSFHNMPREDMIEDFEYLMTVLEENWPFFNLSLSANGVDVNELAANVRTMLHDPQTIIDSPFDFFDIMQVYFYDPIGQLGHLSQYPGHEHFFASLEGVRRDISHGAVSTFTRHMNEVLSRQEAILFYTQLREAGRGRPVREWPETAYEFSIIEPGRVAHISVNTMIPILTDGWLNRPYPPMWHYERLNYNFVEEIADFGHLIFDFRGNLGGSPLQFLEFIIPQYIHETLVAEGHAFYLGGSYTALAREIFDVRTAFPAYRQSLVESYGPEYEETNLSPEDVPFLDTSIPFEHSARLRLIAWSMSDIYEYGRGMGGDRPEALFDGKIWILTDGQTASAAEYAVFLLGQDENITIVGEPTMGLFGTQLLPLRIYLTLPNTGIVVRFDVAYFTDMEGRPLQGYGLEPQYRPRPGMDALETVLTMIEEGTY